MVLIIKSRIKDEIDELMRGVMCVHAYACQKIERNIFRDYDCLSCKGDEDCDKYSKLNISNELIDDSAERRKIIFTGYSWRGKEYKILRDGIKANRKSYDLEGLSEELRKRGGNIIWVLEKSLVRDDNLVSCIRKIEGITAIIEE